MFGEGGDNSLAKDGEQVDRCWSYQVFGYGFISVRWPYAVVFEHGAIPGHPEIRDYLVGAMQSAIETVVRKDIAITNRVEFVFKRPAVLNVTVNEHKLADYWLTQDGEVIWGRA